MFLHIGENISVPIRNIVGIFDLEATTTTKETREFLSMAEEEGFVRTISEEMPKSFLVTEEKGRSIVYLTPISVATLRKRISLRGKYISEESINNHEERKYV